MNRLLDAARNLAEATRLAADLGSETTSLIDERFLNIAERATSQEGSFFTVIGRAVLEAERPDSVNHNLTLLPPNALSTQETIDVLGLVDLMLSPQGSADLTKKFIEFTTEEELFKRIIPTPSSAGEDFIVVSNHLQLPDQGFTMGLLQKAAMEQGHDKLENFLTAVVGRLIGYYQLGDKNVIDDILRKAGSILKTFPSGGKEAMSEDERALSVYRKICNHRTKVAFQELLSARRGSIVCMAPSGEKDEYDADLDAVTMRRFGKGTADLLITASKLGATIIPVFVDYGPDDSIAEFLQPIKPGQVRTFEDCDIIGESIAATGTYARGRASIKKPDVKRYKTKIVYKGN